MKCKFCGNEVEEGTKFCPVCGTEVLQENNSADGEQPTKQYEDPNKQTGSGYGQYGYGQGGYSQSNTYQKSDNEQPDGSQGGYSYGQFDNNQGGYSNGQFDNGQGGYSYGQSDSSQGGYSYGQSDSSQGGYNYGQPDNNNQSNYGQSGDSFNQPDYDQSGNSFNQSDYGQSGDGYNQPNYNQPGNYYSQPNFGQPVEQISSTPYLVFSILSTICCCLPLGVVSIVYASKISSLQRLGDYEGAQDAAKKAKIFSIASAIIGLIASIILGMSGALDVFEEYENDMGTSSVVSGSLDDDDEDKDDDDIDNEKPEQTAPVEASEDLGASWKSYTVQINNTVLTFPCSISEVETTGLMMDTETTPEDYVINKDDYEFVFFDDDDYHSLMFVVSNNTEEALTVKECTVNGVYVNDYDVEEGNITVIFPGDIQIGTDINTVIEKWGEPDDSYEGDYADSYIWYDGDSLNCCMVSVDSETDKVTTIDLDGQQLK